MMPHRFTLFHCLTILSAFCLAGLLLGCEPTEQTKSFAAEKEQGTADYVIPEPKSREKMPDFTLPLLSGGTFDASEQQGKVLLVNFWATWCAPCREEIPDLIALHEELKDDGFAVIGITVDTDGSALVKQFADEMQITYPILLDETSEVAESFGGVYALPTTYVVDKTGTITHRTIGLFPVDAVKESLITLINAE